MCCASMCILNQIQILPISIQIFKAPKIFWQDFDRWIPIIMQETQKLTKIYLNKIIIFSLEGVTSIIRSMQ